MTTLIGIIALCIVYIFIIWRIDVKRQMEYDAWKEENGFTDDDVGI
jgi:hypothetical protein